MKICMITDTYYPTFDGIVRYLDYLIPELIQKEHQVIVVCPNAKGFKHRSSPMDGLTVVRTWTSKFKMNAYRFAFPGLRLLHEIRKSDFVFIHSLMPLGIFGGIFAKIFRKKVGFFCHHDERVILQDIANFKPIIIKSLYRNIRRYYSKIVDIFFHATERFKRKLLYFDANQDKIVHTPFAIDNSNFKKTIDINLREKYNIPNDAIIATYLGRLSVEKNVDNIIKALDSAMDEHQNLYALIVGGGPDKQKFIQQNRKHKDRIIFTGFVPEDELYNHYEVSDMFVTPTLNESSCFTVFEAMTCKVPVITSEMDHDPDIVHEYNALLIKNVLDPEEIKHNIVSLIRDENLRLDIAMNGYHLISSRTWENHAERFLIGLEELVDIYDKDDHDSNLQRKPYFRRARS